MPLLRPTQAFIPPRYYAVLVDTLTELGHDPAQLLALVAQGPALLTSEARLLTLSEVEALVSRAVTLEDTDDLGLRVGQRLQVMSHGSLSVAALTAPTTGAALETVVEFFQLLMPLFSLAVHRYGEATGVRLSVRWPLAPEVERFHTATMSGSIYAQFQFLLGGALPPGVELDARHPRPQGLPAWVDDVGVKLHFGADHYEIRLPTSALTLPMPLADVRSHELARQRCQELLDARPDPSRLSDAVARLLSERGPPFLSLEETARALSLSSRSLRRRLESEGSSFRSVLEEVRLSLADDWLGDPQRTITEIGISLGFTDTSNFSRAYRRARGLSPAKAREERTRERASRG